MPTFKIMSTGPIVYRSKISYFIFIPLLLALLASIIMAIVEGQIAPVLILSATGILLLLPMIFNTKYIIDGDTLKVISGLVIKKDIIIANIKEIKSTKSIFSAPAMSLKDRIEIFYNKYDSVVISPYNKINFCETLKQINPAIVVIL